jgi:hypothetical protein
MSKVCCNFGRMSRGDVVVNCVHFSRKKNLEKFFENFSRNARKKIKNQIRFYYTFGILTTKMYTKLASIEIND